MLICCSELSCPSSFIQFLHQCCNEQKCTCLCDLNLHFCTIFITNVLVQSTIMTQWATSDFYVVVSYRNLTTSNMGVSKGVNKLKVNETDYKNKYDKADFHVPRSLEIIDQKYLLTIKTGKTCRCYWKFHKLFTNLKSDNKYDLLQNYNHYFIIPVSAGNGWIIINN